MMPGHMEEVTTRGLGKTGNETALMSRINTDPSFGSAAIDLRRGTELGIVWQQPS